MEDRITGRLCRHCDAELPPIADAFCPECGSDLDEAPTSPEDSGDYYIIEPPPHRSVILRAFDLLHDIHLWGLRLVAIMVLVNACMEALNWNTWAITILVSVGLVVLAEVIRRHRYWSKLSSHTDSEFDESDDPDSN